MQLLACAHNGTQRTTVTQHQASSSFLRRQKLCAWSALLSVQDSRDKTFFWSQLEYLWQKKKMNIFSMAVTFENLREVRRLCHWGPIIALSVIIICSIMAVLDSILWYWPLDTTGGSINFLMLINWTVLILYNYFNAMFVGPGYIPLGWRPVRVFVRVNVWTVCFTYETIYFLLYSNIISDSQCFAIFFAFN